MATQFMEYSEIKLSRIEQTEDSLTDTNIFIRKIFLLGFIEYFITFSVCTGIFVSFAYIPFLLCYILSFIFQFYFELQSAIENQRIRQKLNIVIGSISIITNCFSNYAIWSNICSDNQQILVFSQILLSLFIMMFYANICRTIFQNIFVLAISILIPFFLQFMVSFFWAFKNLNPFTTLQVIWTLLMMVLMAQEMKPIFNTPDEILVNSCRLLGALLQIGPFALKMGIDAYHYVNKLFQPNIQEQVAYLKKVASIFCITSAYLFLNQVDYFSDYVSGQYQLSSWLTQYTTEDKETLQFTLFFWISLGISLILYPIVLLQHQSLSLQLRCIISFIQLLFYCFTFYGILLYLLFLSYQTATGFFLFSQFYCSLLGLSMGLLTYTFNIQQQKIYLKFHAFISMIICPFCVWILNIFYNSSLLSFYLLIFFLLFALWISFELEWQIQKGTFQLKQCDFFIGVIQIMELPFSILSRILALLF